MSHAAEFDEYGHKDHGHVIVSIFTLRFVLIALLILTLATSGAAYAEQIIADVFHVTIPQWINAAVALSIAVVKTGLVVGYFMQLKYDNPMNTIIFVFTLLTVASFLGFVTLDLGKRDTIDRIKNVYQYPGGDLSTNAFLQNANTGESIVQRAKRIAKENGTYDPHHEHHYPERQIIQDMGFVREDTEAAKQVSSTNRSRPVAGVTIPGLPGYHAPKEGHAHGAADHNTAGHAAPASEHKDDHKDAPKDDHAPAPAKPASSPH